MTQHPTLRWWQRLTSPGTTGDTLTWASWLQVYAACMVVIAWIGYRDFPLIAWFFYAFAHVALYQLVFRCWEGRWQRTRATGTVIVVAILIRCVFLPFPVSDDVYRYAWEGKAQLLGHNPYLQSPAELATAAPHDPIRRQVNHPDFPAVYPPLTELIFRATAAICYRDGASPAAVLTGFKLLMILADLLTVVLLLLILRALDRPPWWAAIYAWNPLVILYGTGEAHLDVLQNLFLALGLWGFLATRPRAWLGYLALGCAALCKYLAAIAVPWFTTRRHLRWLPLVLLPLLAYLPFYEPGIFHGLGRFSTQLHANDLLPRLLRLAAPESWQTPLLLLLVLAGLAAIWLIKQDTPLPALLLAWGWLICCLPTVHPWYLLPVLLLAALKPHRAWWVLSATMGFQFWIYHRQALTGSWTEPPWLWAATYIPFLGIALWDACHPRRPWLTRHLPPAAIDIVIPVLNEAERLPQLLTALDAARDRLAQTAPDVLVDTIIVDGGSTDATPVLARQGGATVVTVDRPGRGSQFAAGIRHGTGDLVLMLHADAVITPDALHKLWRDLAAHPEVEWGILGHVYDRRTWRMRLIELSNRLRFNLAGIAFGDQGIFVRADILHRIGGMPTYRLMEDVELSLRLAASQYRLQVGSSLRVSTRSWERKRFGFYTLQVLTYVTWYLLARRLGADMAALADRLYRAYYRRA